MKKRTKIIVSIVTILVILGIGIGVKVHMDNIEEQKKNQELKLQEKRIANDVEKSYVNIEKITFTGYSLDDNTGEIFYGFKLNDEKREYIYVYSNKTDFGEVAESEKAIENFYKKKKDTFVNMNNAKIEYSTKEDK